MSGNQLKLDQRNVYIESFFQNGQIHGGYWLGVGGQKKLLVRRGAKNLVQKYLSLNGQIPRENY